MLEQFLLNHINAQFRANDSQLRITWARHCDALGSSTPIFKETDVIQQINDALAIEDLKSISITDNKGNELFGINCPIIVTAQK